MKVSLTHCLSFYSTLGPESRPVVCCSYWFQTGAESIVFLWSVGFSPPVGIASSIERNIVYKMLSCVYFKGQLDYVRFKNQELILCGDNDLTKTLPGHSEGLWVFLSSFFLPYTSSCFTHWLALRLSEYLSSGLILSNLLSRYFILIYNHTAVLFRCITHELSRGWMQLVLEVYACCGEGRVLHRSSSQTEVEPSPLAVKESMKC